MRLSNASILNNVRAHCWVNGRLNAQEKFELKGRCLLEGDQVLKSIDESMVKLSNASILNNGRAHCWVNGRLIAQEEVELKGGCF